MIRGRLAASVAALALLAGCTRSGTGPADPAPQPTGRAAHGRASDRTAGGLEGRPRLPRQARLSANRS
jgi:hypothetical protein